MIMMLMLLPKVRPSASIRAFSIFVLTLAMAVPGTSYAADTTRVEIAPGVIHHEIDDPDKPLRIIALEINISRPNLSIGSAVANDELGSSFETTQSMSRRYDSDDKEAIGAINGDYFGISDPSNPYSFLSNLMIKDDEYVIGKSYSRSQFGFKTNGMPFADMVSFEGNAYLPGDEIVELDGVNRDRGGDQAIVFNRYIGEHTRTNEHGVELLLAPVDEPVIGEPMEFEVIEIESGVGSMEIPDYGYYVLSAHGSKRDIVQDHAEEGDIISLELGTDVSRDDISHLMGGGPRLITDGEFPSQWDGLENFQTQHNMNRHPRTAVGMSKDSSRIYLMVVEGRQDASRGATMEETAHYIHGLGAWNAVNLDGGGSSTIIIQDSLANRPNGGSWQRPVGSALIAFAGPYDYEDEFGGIEVTPKEKLVKKGDNFSIDVRAFNEWGEDVEFSMADIEWEVIDLDAPYGRGGFLAQSLGEGYIVAHYQDEYTDTTHVRILETLGPFEITDWKDLYEIRDDPDFDYVLTTDLDQNSEGYETYNVDQSWVPIGDLNDNPFTGTFDGNGYSIRGLNIDEPETDYLGLFAYIDGAEIRNLNVTDADITGLRHLGILAGRIDNSSVTNCHADGTIYATSTVNVGGLAGSARDNSEIRQCFADVDIEVTEADADRRNTGGLVGYLTNNAKISNSYSLGVVAGGRRVGGLVGLSSNDANVSYSFSAVNVTATGIDGEDDDHGGLVGASVSGATVTNSFYDIQASGTDENDGGSGLTTTEMQSGQTFVDAGWDFVTIDQAEATWGINPDENQGYPFLTWQGFNPIAVEAEREREVTEDFKLSQNYPNPFNPDTRIQYQLPEQTHARLVVYDVLGRPVKVLVDEEQSAGTHQVVFDATQFASGTYIYELTAGSFVQRRTMTLVK